MANRKLEDEIERLGLLREAPRDEAVAALRKALRDRANLLVSKAAKVISELKIQELIPDLRQAFDRLMEKGAERDPQCWGKNALARSLTELEYDEAPPFLRGMRHVQMEASWGKPEDTAQTLRGLCLLALIPCSGLRRADKLRHLVDGMADSSHRVRSEAIRALEQMEGEESALLLRFKARSGDEEASVLGQAFDSLLNLERERAIPFVQEFLCPDTEIGGEAALALGSCRLPEGAEVLRKTWEATREPEFRKVILRALSVSRQDRAFEFLLGLVKDGRTSDAKGALEALSLHRASPEIRVLVEGALVEAGPAAQGLFSELFD